MDEINLNGDANSEDSSSDDEVVIEEQETSEEKHVTSEEPFPYSLAVNSSNEESPFNSIDGLVQDWAEWRKSLDSQVDGSNSNPFVTAIPEVPSPPKETETKFASLSTEQSELPNGSSDTSTDNTQEFAAVTSASKEDVEFVGVEVQGTEKAMERALKEGIVGEAGAMKRSTVPNVVDSDSPTENDAANKEFNDSNFWKVDQEVSGLE